MSNKKQTSIQEAIDLIKQDYEANGRLRLAFVLQTLNKADGKHKQEIMDAHHCGRNFEYKYPESDKTYDESAGQYYKDNYETDN